MSSSPVTSPAYYDDRYSDCESGYASAASSIASLPDVHFTKPHLAYINSKLSALEPEDILKWAIISLPGLFQETAFGLSGLVSLDLLAKLSAASPKTQVPLLFMDTLYNFDETLDLVDRVRSHYPHVNLHITKPAGVETTAEFEAKYGKELWKTDEENYDWVAKVEPAERAYRELGVKAVLTGRRRGQGGARKQLDIVEVVENGLIKVNPLANWTFKQVKSYIDENSVPYNALLDQGYKSVGDWHSTEPVAEGEDERAGRWKGRDKTECGIHNPKSRYAQFLADQARQEEEKALQDAFERKLVVA